MTRTLQQHQVKPACPLSCLENVLPAKPFRAVRNHLAEHEHFAHPTVGDVIDLHQHSGLTGIRGLGAQGIEITTAFLEQARLIPARTTMGNSTCNPDY